MLRGANSPHVRPTRSLKAAAAARRTGARSTRDAAAPPSMKRALVFGDAAQGGIRPVRGAKGRLVRGSGAAPIRRTNAFGRGADPTDGRLAQRRRAREAWDMSRRLPLPLTAALALTACAGGPEPAPAPDPAALVDEARRPTAIEEALLGEDCARVVALWDAPKTHAELVALEPRYGDRLLLHQARCGRLDAALSQRLGVHTGVLLRLDAEGHSVTPAALARVRRNRRAFGGRIVDADRALVMALRPLWLRSERPETCAELDALAREARDARHFDPPQPVGPEGKPHVRYAAISVLFDRGCRKEADRWARALVLGHEEQLEADLAERGREAAESWIARRACRYVRDAMDDAADADALAAACADPSAVIAEATAARARFIACYHKARAPIWAWCTEETGEDRSEACRDKLGAVREACQRHRGAPAGAVGH